MPSTSEDDGTQRLLMRFVGSLTDEHDSGTPTVLSPVCLGGNQLIGVIDGNVRPVNVKEVAKLIAEVVKKDSRVPLRDVPQELKAAKADAVG